jgi:tetratricopeptide (TPR) repeat protein
MSFTVRDFRDLIYILEKNPEWQTELRRLVLTENLLTLPEIVRELAEAQRRTEEQVRALTEAQRRADERLGRVEERMDRLEQALAALAEAQRRAEERLSRVEERIDRLEERMDRLERALAALAEAQRRTEERLDALAEAQRRTEERLEALAEAQRRTEERLEALAEALETLTKRVDRLTDEVGALKGSDLERRYWERATSYFDDLLRRIRVLSDWDLAALLDEAVAKGALSRAERKDLLESDLVVVGRRWEDDAEAYLAVEVSVGLGEGDVKRAARRATLLDQAVARPSIAVVAGEWLTPEARQQARKLGVWRVLDGRALAPTEE